MHPSVFDEMRADGVDGEVDAILRAVVAHTAYPLVVAGTVAAEALAVASASMPRIPGLRVGHCRTGNSLISEVKYTKKPPYHQRYGGFFCDKLGELSTSLQSFYPGF